MDDLLEHPDVSSIQRNGYPASQSGENQDSPENRSDYIEEHMLELVKWLQMGYPDILDEFIEMSGHVCAMSYKNWLN